MGWSRHLKSNREKLSHLKSNFHRAHWQSTAQKPLSRGTTHLKSKTPRQLGDSVSDSEPRN